jgi:uncharacterized protein
MNKVVLDTSVLVRVVLDEGADGDALRALLARRSVRGTLFAVPVFSVSEFWAIVTDARAPARIQPSMALVVLRRLLLEGASLLMPGPAFWPLLEGVLGSGLPIGPGVFGCQVAALCREHGIRELWTFDRAFEGIEGIDAVNPLALIAASPED